MKVDRECGCTASGRGVLTEPTQVIGKNASSVWWKQTAQTIRPHLISGKHIPGFLFWILNFNFSSFIIRQMVITISRMATDKKYHVNWVSIITKEWTFCPVYLKKILSSEIQKSYHESWVDIKSGQLIFFQCFLIFCSADERQQWCGRNSLDGGVSSQLTISSSELAFYHIW